MGYKSLSDCVQDLKRQNQLICVTESVDPYLEVAEIQRRLYLQGGPAVLFQNLKGCRFPAVCNLFGTKERARYILRHGFEKIQKGLRLKADPSPLFKRPWRYAPLLKSAVHALPKRVRKAPILAHQTRISQLPQIHSWPKDGGAFITLPQVCSLDPERPSPLRSNLGMYRVQLSGNDYVADEEIGLHYQIHRGIGVHHSSAKKRGEPLKVSIFIGGPPAHSLAAVMPLPEGMSELLFAGALSGRRFRYVEKDGHLLSADADFCITGTIEPTRTKPEGPFGDHLGYYSLTHDFPVMRVEGVYHRPDAIWPFTIVGRPPQEDSQFGWLIHELTGPVVSTELPGVHALHAVDAAGVHPLLFALGSERYVPYGEREPQEILTQANAVLGFGQCSLAKYLLIAAQEDIPDLDIHDEAAFIQHVLERVDWKRDLHFQTQTTMDTLDYSGTGLNKGSKVVWAAAGAKKRELGTHVPSTLSLPEGFENPQLVLPGVLAIQGKGDCEQLCRYWEQAPSLEAYPLVVIVDDSAFTSATLNNFLWVTFTRSNPSHDIYGVGAEITHKHWGCTGPLVIDARIKPHHAPPLEEDAGVSARVDLLGCRGSSLHGLI